MIGKTIQGYRVDALLGEGGMGKVYLAVDLALDRKVAIKNLNANLVYDPTFLQRFTNEARILSRLSHPNIALLYNYIQEGSDHYMVMEYVAGDNMDAYLRKNGALEPDTLVPILVALLDGLGYAHQKNVLHRDIKPANLMLTPQGDVKIMDFGIARISDQANRLTKVKSVIGTLDYLAPELIQGADPSPASDCYALGVVAYELAAGGVLPFKGTSEFALMQAIINGNPLPLDKLKKTVPRKLAGIIAKAMEADPARRFADTSQFREALLRTFPNYRAVRMPREKSAPAPTEILMVTGAAPAADVPGTRVFEPTAIGGGPSPAISTDGMVKEKQYRNVIYGVGIAAVILVVLAMVFLIWPRSGQSVEKKQAQSDRVEGGKADMGAAVSVAGIPAGTDAATMANVEQLLAMTESEKTPAEGSVPDQSGRVSQSGTTQQETGDVAVDGVTQVAKSEEETTTASDVSVPVAETTPRPAEVEEEIHPVSDKTPPAGMVVDGQVAVSLRLREKLAEDQLKKGRKLSFSVTKPVTYKGYTIIPVGALATAEIQRVGSKQVSIRFNGVSSVNGRTIPFAKSELSGRLSDMLASPDFVVMLEKGVDVP
ncbi:serine/threonine protein kinase [Parapedobacter soli]|uniref:serine/threonine protein kinase n=1 Tax=Parapedobacter soli TaxID=416955 RepID=UPI0021CA1B14|nr:serine/threonine-protein kinase [Parapedobacter soli]